MTSASQSKSEKSYLAAAVDSIAPWASSRSSTPKPSSIPEKESEPARNSQKVADHATISRQGLSMKNYPKDCPSLTTQWFYAVDFPKRKPKLLKEGSKEAKALPPPKKFVPFSQHDSKSIEAAFQRLVEEQEDEVTRRHSVKDNLEVPTTAAESYQNTSISEAGNLEQAGGRVTVPVNEDFLFDVDIEKRELAPAYWLGSIYEVRRGSWFFQEGTVLRPCDENLALQLEEGYLKVKPFRYTSFSTPTVSEVVPTKTEEDEKLLAVPIHLRTDPVDKTPIRSSTADSDTLGKQSFQEAPGIAENHGAATSPEPQTYRLFGAYMNSIVTYQDDAVAWLSSDGIISRVSTTVYQRFAGGGYLGGVKLVRGFTEPGRQLKATEAKTVRPATPNTAVPWNSSNPGLQLDERQQKLLKRRSAPGAVDLIEASDSSEGIANVPEPDNAQPSFNSQISAMAVDSMDLDRGEEAVRKRDEKEMQTDYIEHEREDQSRDIEHLILVTHGIGQRLGMRTESVNFIHDVNVLRKTLKSVYSSSADLQALNSEIDKLPKNCRVQVLPVCWRHLLDFPRQSLKQNRQEHDIGDTSGEEDEYPSLEDITVEGVPFVRSLITDLALDILLYQSAYREHISHIVLRECNRIYGIFLKRNPDFTGKVSLIGHSLGSAILFDLLCRQKSDSNTRNPSKQPKSHQTRSDSRARIIKGEKEPGFVFPVEDFYCLGSPIGLFQMLKGRTIAARHQPGALPAESPMDPDFMEDPFLAASNPSSAFSTGEKISSVTGLPYTISSPECVQLYNIFHPSDPISYRLEPLIAPAMSSLKPQALPYTKKGLFRTSASQGLTGIGAIVGQSVSGLWSSLSSGIANSLLNRSLGLTSDDVASMVEPRGSSAEESPLSVGAGTNISSGGVISGMPALTRENTDEKKRQLAEDTAAADLRGSKANAPTLIRDDIETLYSGFQKRREIEQSTEGQSQQDRLDAEEKGRKLRREELKIRGLNRNGRVDFSIQESVLDFNPINTIASHLSYWADEDVSHFMMSQLLSRYRDHKRGGVSRSHSKSGDHRSQL